MELKPLTLSKIDALIGLYPEPRSALMMVLHAIQEDRGYIAKEAIEWTAQRFKIQPIEVYEVVTFYPGYRQTPTGKKHIKVCRTLSCALAGAYTVCDKLQEKLNCPLGGTSEDGEFTIEFVECLASCGTAPVVMVDDALYEHVRPDTVDAFVSEHIQQPKEGGASHG
ncbi:MAG TPA: NAD(P)H-dependent oxidoreductase subunit E [Opitutales bacterium]|nr:NAD(P)H-dependent oxidoreductase subunit E [Opitutales bacterium]